MKKKIKIIIWCIIVVAVAFVYAHIYKTHNIYDKDVDTSAYLSTGIISSTGIQQQFKTQEEYLDGVRIKCIVSGNTENVIVCYELKELKSGKSVASGKVEAKKAKNSKFLNLPFERVEKTKGKTYEISISLENETEVDGIAFSYEQKTESDTSLTINGEKLKDATLILKTVTHRFDFETFIVLLVFVLYVVLFMRFLYNLFK